MKSLVLFFMILFSNIMYSQCTLTANCAGGDWSNPSTWTPSGCSAGINVPGNGIIIIVPACANVTVDINSPTYTNMEIYVYGTLTFDNGQKINMCPGYVKVFPGGQLTGGTNGSKIVICGESVWNGGGTSSGPLELGGGTTLPIELVSFTGTANKKYNQIKWTVASQTNNDFYTLERSLDGMYWEEINIVDGDGTLSETKTYVYDDVDPTQFCYYRLRQNDFDGKISYSDVISVENRSIHKETLVFPNPFDEEIIIKVFSDVKETITVELTDELGNIVYTAYFKNVGESTYYLYPDLRDGLYTIMIFDGKGYFQSELLIKESK